MVQYLHGTTLDDIAGAIADMGTMTASLITDTVENLRIEMHKTFTGLRRQMHCGFGRLDTRMTTLGIRMTSMKPQKTETNRRLEKIAGFSEATESGIKELYGMIQELRKDFGSFTAEKRRRFARLKDFAQKVSLKTGIPFTLR